MRKIKSEKIQNDPFIIFAQTKSQKIQITRCTTNSLVKSFQLKLINDNRFIL